MVSQLNQGPTSGSSPLHIPSFIIPSEKHLCAVQHLTVAVCQHGHAFLRSTIVATSGWAVTIKAHCTPIQILAFA